MFAPGFFCCLVKGSVHFDIIPYYFGLTFRLWLEVFVLLHFFFFFPESLLKGLLQGEEELLLLPSSIMATNITKITSFCPTEKARLDLTPHRTIMSANKRWCGHALQTGPDSHSLSYAPCDVCCAACTHAHSHVCGEPNTRDAVQYCACTGCRQEERHTCTIGRYI